MADAMVRYAMKHRKLMVAIVLGVFSTGGMFAIARADMETIKSNHAKHAERLTALERESISSHTKLDDIADDVRIIKEHMIGGN